MDGQPLGEAVAVFVPIDRKGQQRGAAVADGQFSLAGIDGLAPGWYRVEFYDERGVAFGPQADHGRPLRQSSIPDRYNRLSSETIEVQTGGLNTFAFLLSTAEK